MAVKGRLRFEVLRRDNHTCRYCGATAPEVKITVDHVVPVALGGTDDPSNLVTACRNCNAGKTSMAPDQSTVTDVAEDALRWAQAMERAASEAGREREDRERALRWFADAWNGWTESLGGDRRYVEVPPDWQRSVDRWLDAGLVVDDLLDLIRVAMKSSAPSPRVWRYFAGCCWNRVRALQQRAAEIVKEADEQDRIQGEPLSLAEILARVARTDADG